jgi:hypothetical protein
MSLVPGDIAGIMLPNWGKSHCGPVAVSDSLLWLEYEKAN